MLAQNLKTSAELGISDVEFDALFRVLGMLERGELKHVRVEASASPFPDYSRGYTCHFNMFRVAIPYGECGTAACILGTARLLFGLKLFAGWEKQGLPENLLALFWPMAQLGARPSGSITPSQAAIALRNYLTHGDPRWAEALATLSDDLGRVRAPDDETAIDRAIEEFGYSGDRRRLVAQREELAPWLTRRTDAAN
jgi:hypothetical protein